MAQQGIRAEPGRAVSIQGETWSGHSTPKCDHGDRVVAEMGGWACMSRLSLPRVTVGASKEEPCGARWDPGLAVSGGSGDFQDSQLCLPRGPVSSNTPELMSTLNAQNLASNTIL